jgi:hypothetical protein
MLNSIVRSTSTFPRTALIVAAILGVVYVAHSPSSAAATDGGFLAASSLAGAVTTGEDALFLDKNFLSFTGSFKVFDTTGAVAYQVQGKVISMRTRKTITNPVTGAPIAYVQKKLVGMRKIYEIYRATPAFEGQASSEEDGDVPLYRYAWVAKAIFGGVTNKYSYAVQTAKQKDPTEVLVAQERFTLNPFQALIFDVSKPGSDEVLATIGKATKFHFKKDASWAIEVGSGMDLVGMLTLAIGVNNIMEDIQDEEENRR